MKNNKNGFTLIEILVAVLIMIILVTMAVPMYGIRSMPMAASWRRVTM